MNIKVLVLLVATQCQPKPEPPDDPTIPPPTPTIVEPLPDPPPPPPITGNRCERGYEKASRLGCPPKDPKTGTWVEFCQHVEKRGIDANPDCLEQADNCEDVRVCLEESPE